MHEISDHQIIACFICGTVIKIKCQTTAFPPKVSISCAEGKKVYLDFTKFEQVDMGVLF